VPAGKNRQREEKTYDLGTGKRNESHQAHIIPNPLNPFCGGPVRKEDRNKRRVPKKKKRSRRTTKGSNA